VSAVGTFMIWGALAGVLLAAIAVLWRGIVRTRHHTDRDDPDAIWLGQLGEGSGEDASIDRRIAANDASRRRVARKGERWLP
jgi:hypothetical protein